MNKIFGILATGIVGLFCSATAFAQQFGTPGIWTSGWGQGLREAKDTVNRNTYLYVACKEFPESGEKPYIALTVNGREVSGFRLTTDSELVESIQGIRRAKVLYAVYGQNTRLKLPTKGSAKALAGCTR